MADRKYTAAEVAYARYWNRLIEEEWQDRLDRGLRSTGRAEDGWRQEQREKRGEG